MPFPCVLPFSIGMYKFVYVRLKIQNVVWDTVTYRFWGSLCCSIGSVFTSIADIETLFLK